MDTSGFRLQSIRIACAFEDTPLFSERVGEVIAHHKLDYTSWGRLQDGFWLRHAEESIEVKVSFGLIDSIKESPSNYTDLRNFIGSIRNLIKDTLKAIDTVKLIDMEARCRFFLPNNSARGFLPILLKFYEVKYLKQFITFFKTEPIDLQYNITFPLNAPYETIQCDFSVYTITSRRDLEYTFPLTYEEHPPGGLVITVHFSPPPDQTTYSLRELEIFLAAMEEKSFNIAKLVEDSLGE